MNAANVELHAHHKKCKLKTHQLHVCVARYTVRISLFSRHKTLKHKNMIIMLNTHTHTSQCLVSLVSQSENIRERPVYLFVKPKGKTASIYLIPLPFILKTGSVLFVRSAT